MNFPKEKPGANGITKTGDQGSGREDEVGVWLITSGQIWRLANRVVRAERQGTTRNLFTDQWCQIGKSCQASEHHADGFEGLMKSDAATRLYRIIISDVDPSRPPPTTHPPDQECA